MSNLYFDPKFTAAQQAKGLSYCPYREAWIPTTAKHPAVCNQTTNFNPAEESCGLGEKIWLRLPMISANAPSPRDYQERFLALFNNNPGESFLLQAPMGSGKTITALYAAASHLQRGERVVFVVPTEYLKRQTYSKALKVFGDTSTFIRMLDGESIAGRVRAYGDPGALLLICVAPSFSNDIRNGLIDPRSFGLTILDEGDQMRGDESVAQILRYRNQLEQKPRTILMSATLAVADTDKRQYQEQVEALKAKSKIDRFIELTPDTTQQAVYKIETERVQLDTVTLRAAEAISQDFWQRVKDINDFLYTLPPSAHSDSAIRALKAFGKAGSSDALILPSFKKTDGAPEALRVVAQRTEDQELKSAAFVALRKSYEIRYLAHAHTLLVNFSRVNFLEYCGMMLFRTRSPGSTGKKAAGSSEQALFPAGRPPAWWSIMSAGTPYELLERVNKQSARPIIEYLKQHKISATNHAEAADKFFWNGKELGVAAQQLSLARSLVDHPKLERTLKWINGPLRKIKPGQLLVTTGPALDAKFLAARLAFLTKESTLALIGRSHTTKATRGDTFSRAESGTASILCATSVVNRGVDLPRLRYLIMLDPTPDVTAAKQYFGRVGRGQDMDGLVVILVTEGCSDELRNFARRAKARSAGTTFPEAKGGSKTQVKTPTLWDK